MTIKWNDLAWNDLTMEQSDQISVQEKKWNIPEAKKMLKQLKH